MIFMSEEIDSKNLTDVDENRKDQEGGRRLKMAIDHAGGVGVVAKRSRVPDQSIRRFIRGREMRRSTLVALADACDVELEWLVSGEGTMQRTPLPHQMTIKDQEGNGTTALFRSHVPIPMYDVRAAAGNGGRVEGERMSGYLALDEEFVRLGLHRRRDDLVSISATGDSMEPNIRDGDLLVVDTSVKEILNGRVYILDVNDALIVKRLSYKLDGSIVVRSDNPKYAEEIVTPSELTPLRIIGEVVLQAGPVRS
jgi:phage repressor protein C with HTH and peptisase S24 domain